MKIAFITYEYPPDTGKGGIGTYTVQIAKALQKKGWGVHVFAGSSYREGTICESSIYVHRIICDSPFDFRTKIVNKFSEIHRQEKFDIIESPEIHGNAWEIKKQFSSIPLIVRLHAPNYLVEHLKKRYIPFLAKLRMFVGALRRFKWDLGYWRPYEKNTDDDYLFTQLADGISAPSEAMKEWVIHNWDIEKEQIEVIPNIFEPSEKLLAIPISENNNTTKRIIFFGRLNVLKGLTIATKALKTILKKNPDWHFRAVGDDCAGPYNGSSMRQWMTDEFKDVLDRVEFIDGVNYEVLPNFLKDTDIVLLPSLFESFSYTCAEAMAAGKAIIGSRNGGMRDLLDNGKVGLLVNPENEYEITNALLDLINHKEKRSDLAFASRKRIIENYNSSVLVQQNMMYYKKYIGIL